jgi:protein ImuB
LPATSLLEAKPHIEALAALGCETIGQLRRLPRAGVARRFGAEVLLAVDRAYGSEPEMFPWYEPAQSFDATVEYPFGAETAEVLCEGVQQLLLQLCGWLTARHAGAQELAFLLRYESGRRVSARESKVLISLSAASRDLDHLASVAKERFGRQVIEAPVVTMSLQVDRVHSLASRSTDLFPAPIPLTQSLQEMHDRLASRIGEDAIQRLRITGDHRPEHCTLSEPFKAPPARDVESTYPPRPLWLLEKPLPLLTREDRPFYQGPLDLFPDVERIEAGWWDDDLVARDYYVARNNANVLLWIFCERQLMATAEPQWFLHGFFG